MESNKINWVRLGNRISDMRLARGITQMELAEQTGLSATYIGYIEQGKRHAKFEIYVNIVTKLGYSMNDLFDEELAEDPTGSLVWELSRALSVCGEDKQDSILQIVRDLVHMIHRFHDD